jgi:hypothetical protein
MDKVNRAFYVGNSYWNASLQQFCGTNTEFSITYAGRDVRAGIGEVVVIAPAKDNPAAPAIFVLDSGTDETVSFTRIR